MVDVSLKLCSLPKITFDIDTYRPDNKIKNCTIQKVINIYKIQNFKLKYVNISMLFKKYAKIEVNMIPVLNSLL